MSDLLKIHLDVGCSGFLIVLEAVYDKRKI